jgi:hypothetical protein
MKFKIYSKSVNLFKHQKPNFFQRLRNRMVANQNHDSYYLEAIVVLSEELPINTVFGCKSDVYIVKSRIVRHHTVVPYNQKMTVGINYALYGECVVLKTDNGFFKK